MCQNAGKIKIQESPRIPMISENVKDFLSRDNSYRSSCQCCYCRQNKCFISIFRCNQCICSSCCHNRSSDRLACIPKLWQGHRRRNDLRQILRKLSDTVLLSLCFLSVIRVPLAMAAPTRGPTPSSSHPQATRPQWACPCGEGTDQDLDEYGLVTGTLSDREVLDHIILQASISLNEANRFKYNYVSRTFGVDYHAHHENWRRNHLGWLPSRQQVPKELGENLKGDHLEAMVIDLALKDIYEFLQKVAVGLEQVVEDQRMSNGEFVEDFIQTENNLRQVLCEIQIAMNERHIEPSGDVSREIMNLQVRQLEDLSHRNLRDWLIFREYMNVLEYVIQVFKYIQERLPL